MTAEERPLFGGNDESVVLDPDRFNLGRELKLVSILGLVEQLMNDRVEHRRGNGQ